MSFFNRVKSFNQMYGMPAQSVPELMEGSFFETQQRLIRFQQILGREMDEGTDIVRDLAVLGGDAGQTEGDKLVILTAIADWLGDIVVYATSEAVKYGIPLELVLEIIMDSNASKMGADGKPIIKDGKLEKGPNYWKPEPKIRELLAALRDVHNRHKDPPPWANQPITTTGFTGDQQ